jgi:hypothetical protein
MNERELKKLEQKCTEFTQKRDARLLKSLQEKLDKAHKIAESFPLSKIRKSTCSRKQNPEICQQLCKCNCVYGLALLIKSGYSIFISEKIKYIITKGEPMEENKNEVVVMSVEYSQAVQADALIESGFEMTQMGIAKVCRGVKLMHDGKLYRQLGFQNFEEYCQNKGFTKQYGNQLVKIAEMLEHENGNSVSVLKNLGVKKLYQLAMLEPEQREEIIQTVDVESVTVKELKSEISTLKQNKQQLESQIQELENRPVEVMQSTAELEEIERLKAEKEALEEQRTELELKIWDYENQEQAVSDAEEKRFAEFASNMNQQLVEERQRLKKESQEEISRANLQRDNAFLEVEKLKKQLDEQKKSPEESPEMKQFRSQLGAVGICMKQLLDFLGEYPDTAFLDKSENALKGVLHNLDEIRKQVQA